MSCAFQPTIRPMPVAHEAFKALTGDRGALVGPEPARCASGSQAWAAAHGRVPVVRRGEPSER